MKKRALKTFKCTSLCENSEGFFFVVKMESCFFLLMSCHLSYEKSLKLRFSIQFQVLFYIKNSMDLHSWKYLCFFLGECLFSFVNWGVCSYPTISIKWTETLLFLRVFCFEGITNLSYQKSLPYPRLELFSRNSFYYESCFHLCKTMSIPSVNSYSGLNSAYHWSVTQ